MVEWEMKVGSSGGDVKLGIRKRGVVVGIGVGGERERYRFLWW